MTRLCLLSAALLLVAGCAGGASPSPFDQATSSASASPTPGEPAFTEIVAWSSATPLPYMTPTATLPPEASACRADQVSAGHAGWQGATGSMLGGFLIWNTSAEPCRLTGRPSVAILDRAGHRLNVIDVPISSPAVQPIVLSAHQPVPVLYEDVPGGLGTVMVQWFNWCATSPIEPLSLAITLPTGGVLHAPVVMGSTPRCDAPSAGSTMSVGNFNVTAGPSPTDPPAVPAEGLRVALEVPGQATAGQTLHYVAILTNPTASPINLDPCPAYMERINSVGGWVVSDYILDCSGVPTIAPGASVRFAMELDLPASLPPSDKAAIVWSLDPYYSEGFPPRSPAAKVPIQVVAP